MPTIESLLSLPPEDLDKLTDEQILQTWGPCFDLEKRLLLDAAASAPQDTGDDEETDIGGQSSTPRPKAPAAKKAKDKLSKMQETLKLLLEQQRELNLNKKASV